MQVTEIAIDSTKQLIDFTSQGNPLIRKMLGEHPQLEIKPSDALTDTLVTLLSEDLTRVGVNDLDASVQLFRALSLVSIPFRVNDIDTYLFPDQESSTELAVEYLGLLLNASLATYKAKGYVLDTALRRLALVEYSLTQPFNYSTSHINLLIKAIEMQIKHPKAAKWYENMLPNFEIKRFITK